MTMAVFVRVGMLVLAICWMGCGSHMPEWRGRGIICAVFGQAELCVELRQ